MGNDKVENLVVRDLVRDRDAHGMIRTEKCLYNFVRKPDGNRSLE
jgi:hypothetical protein